jgi:hypothetical protein
MSRGDFFGLNVFEGSDVARYVPSPTFFGLKVLKVSDVARYVLSLTFSD